MTFANQVYRHSGLMGRALVGAVAFGVLGLTATGVEARTDGQMLAVPARSLGESAYDAPPPIARRGNSRVASAVTQSRAPGDTLSFGNVDGDGFAILGDVWTFDHGGGDPLEGWYAVDVTAQSDAYWRRITDASWDADPDHLVDAPVLTGQGSAWLGATGLEANELCWEGGLGYGNQWCQRLVSPVQVYDGSSDVDLSWIYFNDTEEDFDYTRVYLETLPSGERTSLAEYTGLLGLAPDHPASPPVGVSDAVTLVAADFQGEVGYRIVFEMTSDGGWSDEDGIYTTEYGPAAFDDVSVDGNVSSFENDLDGWTAEGCPGVGAFLGVGHVSDYNIEDTCDCALSENVLKLHDDDEEHPDGQRVEARSAPVDALNDVLLPNVGHRVIFARWTQYSDLPRANGVYYRPGWDYFPFSCPSTGAETWSGRVGQNTWFFVGDDAECNEYVSSATAVDVPVPPDAEQVRFLYEIYSSCDAFSISEEVCTEMTNFSPLIDNITIRFTEVPDAPAGITLAFAGLLADGYAQGTVINDPAMPGNADVSSNVNFKDIPPFVLGDSLYISGPLPSSDPSTQWEGKLWFRVPRVGPLADSRYTDWRDRVADGRQIDGVDGEFTFAFMDSFEVGTNVSPNKFVSYLREDDDDFDPVSGDLSTENEIIADGVLFPGTQVEYFVSANYIGNSQSYLLPDTSGGFAFEFEILPRWRYDEGTLKYPCLLYVDVGRSGVDYYVEQAFGNLGLLYDKFDHPFADGVGAPMFRERPEVDTAGMTLAQMLGYRGVLVTIDNRRLWPSDYLLLSDWLTATICEGATARRGLVMNGDRIARGASIVAAGLLTQLGATFVDEAYSEYAGDNNACVRVEAPVAAGESYGTENSMGDYEYDAWGNWCPTNHRFDVMGTSGSGVGNRVYLRVDDLSTETEWAQVTNERLDTDNYRTVIDAVSYAHMSAVDPVDECTSQEAAIVEAATNEIRSALEWIYGVGNLPGLCEDPCTTTNVPGGGGGPAATGIRTHLQAPAPNPFNPRTTLRFGLAETGPVDLAIYDVGGRRVRTLVDGDLDAGEHELTWDGTDDLGRELSAGVYWMKLQAGGFDHAARVVRLR